MHQPLHRASRTHRAHLAGCQALRTGCRRTRASSLPWPSPLRWHLAPPLPPSTAAGLCLGTIPLPGPSSCSRRVSPTTLVLLNFLASLQPHLGQKPPPPPWLSRSSTPHGHSRERGTGKSPSLNTYCFSKLMWKVIARLMELFFSSFN